MERMPVLFVGHGSPMNAIEDNEFSRAWSEAGKSLPRPKAILCVSAHWETPGTQVTAMDTPKTIYDFYGFPPELYAATYPAPGSPELAQRVIELVRPKQFFPELNTGQVQGASSIELARRTLELEGRGQVTPDLVWGLDHGAWSVLKRMFPQADVPVVQLSLDRGKSPCEHFDLGRKLQPLRDEGILILGSGNVVHNLGMVVWEDRAFDWAVEFDAQVKQWILADTPDPLIDYSKQGRAAALSINSAEHFKPLLYVLGARTAGEPAGFFNEKVSLGLDVDALGEVRMKLPAGWEESTLETNGVRLHVVTAGDPGGKPVVLLHGFPEFWYGWHHQIPALAAAGYRVIVPDQRGHNLSDVPKGAGAYRTEVLVDDVLGLLDHFGCERVCLAGHDWGAAVAWSLAIRHPERLERLAILNVPHTDVMWQTIRRSPRQMLKSWYIGFFQIPGLADGLMRLGHFAGACRLLRSSGSAGTFSDADLEEYRQAWTNSGGLTGMIDWYRAAVRFRSHSRGDRRVHVPVLILWGRRDVALSAGMAQGSLALCDDGRLVFFDAATHWVQHDAAEQVNRELTAFFGQ